MDEITKKQKEELNRFLDLVLEAPITMKDKDKIKTLNEIIENITKLEIERINKDFGWNNDFEIILEENIPESEKNTWAICLRYPKKNKIIYYIQNMYEDLKDENLFTRQGRSVQFIQTIFHELRHYVQEVKVNKNISCVENLKYAKNMVIQYKFWDWHLKNYDKIPLENEAQIYSFERMLELLDGEFKELTKIWNADEKGKMYVGQYQGEIIIDPYTKYIFFPEDKDKILNNLINIVRSKHKNLFEMMSKRYPILIKEYNMDGSRKTLVELIENMTKEIDEIKNRNSKEFSLSQKRKLIKDVKEMYYEILYYAMEEELNYKIKKCEDFSHIEELENKIDKNQMELLLKEIETYFQESMEHRLGMSAKKIEAYSKYYNLSDVKECNNRYIKIIENGEEKICFFDEFIKRINSKLLNKEFVILDDDKKEIKTGKQIIKDDFFNYIPEDGKIILKDKREVTAKEFFENYILNQEIKTKDDIKKLFNQINIWNVQKIYINRLSKEYERKNERISEFSEILNNRIGNKNQKFKTSKRKIKLTEINNCNNENER